MKYFIRGDRMTRGDGAIPSLEDRMARNDKKLCSVRERRMARSRSISIAMQESSRNGRTPGKYRLLLAASLPSAWG